jgi:hypothetical protein
MNLRGYVRQGERGDTTRMGWGEGTVRGTRLAGWIPAIGAVVVLLTALAAGLVLFGLAGADRDAPEPDLAWPPDSWASRTDLDAHSVAANETLQGVNCAPGLLFVDERNLPSGGDGALEFVLEESCRMDAVLTVRFAVGDLGVRLEGPAGVVFADEGTNVAVMGGGVGSNPAEEHPGPHPPGTYRYSFTADGPVEFRFRVEGSP